MLREHLLRAHLRYHDDVLALVQLRHVQPMEGEVGTRPWHRVALTDPVSEAPQVQRLQRPRVQSQGPGLVTALGRPLDDDRVDPRQPQLPRQHQAGRSSTRDDYGATHEELL